MIFEDFRLCRPYSPIAHLRYHLRNRSRLAPVSPTPPPGFFTEEFWIRRIPEMETAIAMGQESRWVIADPAQPEEIWGQINLTSIIRGPLQSCFLGYSIDAQWEGRGVMTRAVGAVVDHAFRDLGLHRVMANHLPENKRSAQLLARLGFAVEGYARSYLLLDGVWRDHVLNAKIAF